MTFSSPERLEHHRKDLQAGKRPIRRGRHGASNFSFQFLRKISCIFPVDDFSDFEDVWIDKDVGLIEIIATQHQRTIFDMHSSTGQSNVVEILKLNHSEIGGGVIPASPLLQGVTVAVASWNMPIWTPSKTQ